MSNQCLSFMMTNIQWRKLWQNRVFLKILLKLGSSWPLIYPAISQYINIVSSENDNDGEEEEEGDDDDYEANAAHLLYPSDQRRNTADISDEEEKEYDDDDDEDDYDSGDGLYPSTQRERKWYISNGGSDRISLFSQRGRNKSINQDSMLAWEVCSSINRYFANTELSRVKF